MVDPSHVSDVIPWPDLGIDGEPELLFQPAVDLATGRLLGFEALLRLRRCVPVPGYISPNELIPCAEANGHMKAVNDWVLSEACSKAAAWRPEIQLAVNCSVFQLRRHEASASAAAALEVSGLDAGRLSIEFTESALADDRALHDLGALAKLGVQLTLDDMVADWSSVTDLKRIAVSTVKIDGSFIGGLDHVGGSNRSIVETIVKVIHSLDLCTGAKAVETAGQDVGQGYFFAPPLAAEEALALASMDTIPILPLSTEHRETVTSDPGESGAEDVVVAELIEVDPSADEDFDDTLVGWARLIQPVARSTGPTPHAGVEKRR
jgi:EAL domain-containing protein (putative c-di-GMP-specific phosphodiesterase class I)